MKLYDLTTQKIQEALMNDERTEHAVIEVINEDGIITLKGNVDSGATAQAAEEIVSSQSGVTLVVNGLLISSK